MPTSPIALTRQKRNGIGVKHRTTADCQRTKTPARSSRRTSWLILEPITLGRIVDKVETHGAGALAGAVQRDTRDVPTGILPRRSKGNSTWPPSSRQIGFQVFVDYAANVAAIANLQLSFGGDVVHRVHYRGNTSSCCD